MGQVMQKITKSGDEAQPKKQNKLKNLIDDFIDKNHEEYQKKITDLNDFYHAVYEISEKISEQSGAMQFRLPTIQELEKIFKEVHPYPLYNLKKEEFTKIMEKVITLDRFYIGRGARDVFLYIFGIPVVALLAKKIIPGPTSAISDDVFIPAVTSATVVILAKNNRL